MKKKVEVKKQIVPLYQTTQFWTYKIYTPEQLQALDNFFNNFDKQLKALMIQPNLEDNYRILCEKVGYDIHPSLSKGKTVTKQQNNTTEEFGDKYIMIVNHKIDALTLKLLAYACPLTKLTTIKFSNNNMNTEELKLAQSIITKDQNVSVVFFQWNPISEVELSKNVFSSFIKQNLKSLILRSSKIGDIVLKEVVGKIIQSSQTKLKHLDLYDNDLTSQSIPFLKQLLLANKPLQHMDLSKNNLESGDSLKLIFDSIGMFAISPSQLEAHRMLQKQRDQIIQKNKKRKKGTPQEPIPNVPKIDQVNQEWFYIRNNKMKSLNLSWNKIGSGSFNIIHNFLQRVNPKQSESLFLLNVSGNEFNKQENDLLKSKFGIKI